MICEKCGKNNATTHIRTVVNGVITEHNLCGYCAAKEGYTDFGHNSLGDMLASVFGDVLASGASGASLRCPCCGAAFSDIAESGRVGCAECYKTFYNELLPYLKRVHGSTKHTGRIPNRAPLVAQPAEDSIEALRNKLSELVAAERFEEAAVIRDRIKKAEEEKQ